MAKRFYSRVYWEARIQEWQASGQSARVWCQKHQVVYTTFLKWYKRLEELKQAEKQPSLIVKPANHFIELKDQTAANSGIILECAGVKIHVSCQFEATTLHRCLAVLRGARC